MYKNNQIQQNSQIVSIIVNLTSFTDREERRWIEKNNRVQRNERKKEEMKRIRKLVDNTYNSDPRIANFREMDKQEKLAKKKAKQDAAQARRDEEERIRYKDRAPNKISLTL